jgi:hypothetical protein
MVYLDEISKWNTETDNTEAGAAVEELIGSALGLLNAGRTAINRARYPVPTTGLLRLRFLLRRVAGLMERYGLDDEILVVVSPSYWTPERHVQECIKTMKKVMADLAQRNTRRVGPSGLRNLVRQAEPEEKVAAVNPDLVAVAAGGNQPTPVSEESNPEPVKQKRRGRRLANTAAVQKLAPRLAKTKALAAIKKIVSGRRWQ